MAIGDQIELELSCAAMRWVHRFPLDALDVGRVGHTMLNEQDLAHDNLTRLFPRRSVP